MKPRILAAALILSIAVAFSPRYWPIAVAVGSVSLLGIVWALTTPSIHLDSRVLPAYAAVALLSVWAPVQLALHSTATPWLTGRAALNWLAFGIAFLLASQILTSDRARQLFLDILLWAVAIFAVLAIIQIYSDTPRVYGLFTTGTQTVGTFLYKNQFAAMLELAAPIALWRALRDRENPAFGALIFALLFAAAVASASRAGVILMAAEFVCALAIAVRQRRISHGTAVSVAAGLLLLLALTSAIAGPEKILAHFQEKNPWSTRRQLLDSTVGMIRQHPWFGSGAGSWRTLYPHFATFDNALVANEAHNDWAEWAAESGLPFTCLMLLLVLSIAPAAFSTIWGLGVLAVMLHSLIDYPTREPALGLLWFSLAGALVPIRPAAKIYRENPRRRVTIATGTTDRLLMRYLTFFLFALLTALPGKAQQPRPSQTVPGIEVQSTTGALPLQRVGTEDLLSLQVYDAPEFTRSVRVGDDGTIRLPMLQATIPVQGLLPNEIEARIAQALQREKLFVDPFVTVNVIEYHSRPISVNGAVKAPTIFQAVGTVTLLDALARAGGMTDMAGGEIVITRPGELSVQRVPARALLAGTDPLLNLRLTGGEEIRVPEVGKIVVWGNVTKSGVYPVLDGGSSTVTTAIAQAEGLTHFAAHDAYIYRPDEQGVKHEIRVDLSNIMKRKSPDVTLMARDVLYVPDSTGRRLATQTLDRLTGFAASTASGVLIYDRPH